MAGGWRPTFRRSGEGSAAQRWALLAGTACAVALATAAVAIAVAQPGGGPASDGAPRADAAEARPTD